MTLDEEDQTYLDSGPLALDFGNDNNLIKTKCTPCETVTVHTWTKVEPYDISNNTDILDLIKLHRRLIMCTECGNLSLKK